MYFPPNLKIELRACNTIVSDSLLSKDFFRQLLLLITICYTIILFDSFALFFGNTKLDCKR